MSIPYYQVDAFTSRVFSGNPAGVCLLADWLPDALLQSIAAENNLAETAFIVPRDSLFHLRWFTPALEMDLCGHATLAAAHAECGRFSACSRADRRSPGQRIARQFSTPVEVRLPTQIDAGIGHQRSHLAPL